MLRNLKTGDVVTTTGGIVGTIVSVDEDTIVLRVKPDNLKLQFSRASVGHLCFRKARSDRQKNVAQHTGHRKNTHATQFDD